MKEGPSALLRLLASLQRTERSTFPLVDASRALELDFFARPGFVRGKPQKRLDVNSRLRTAKKQRI
jgi:hypothetical protein